LKNEYINVIPKQDSGFDRSDIAFSFGSYESQILNLVEESLFTRLFQNSRIKKASIQSSEYINTLDNY